MRTSGGIVESSFRALIRHKAEIFRRNESHFSFWAIYLSFWSLNTVSYSTFQEINAPVAIQVDFYAYPDKINSLNDQMTFSSYSLEDRRPRGNSRNTPRIWSRIFRFHGCAGPRSPIAGFSLHGVSYKGFIGITSYFY